jgi:hypothetical protein
MTAVLGAAALVLAAASTFAQGKTNFAGKWTLVVDPAAAGGGGRGGRGGGGGGGFACGPECTITQDAATLTVTRTTQAGEQKFVVKLDGSESKNTVMGRGGEATEQVSKATWAGANLVITTTLPNGEAKVTLSIDGGNLVVDRSAPGREGTPVTTKQTYKKG